MNRDQMGRTPPRRCILALSAALALLLSSALPANASGAIKIGQASPTDPLADCGSVQNLLQNTWAGTSPSYSVPSPGVITAWAHRGDNTTPGSGGLQVWRSEAGPFRLVGKSTLQSFTAQVVNVFRTRIPVGIGNLIGFRSPETTNGCLGAGLSASDGVAVETGTDPNPGDLRTFMSGPSSVLLNVEAVLEADADGDGFGDESQDDCPGQAGTNSGCPPATPAAQPQPPTAQAAPVKRCKKGQKLRKGKCVKKKRKK